MYLMTAMRSVSPLNRVAWTYSAPDPDGTYYGDGADKLDLATLTMRSIPDANGASTSLPTAAAVGAIPVSTGAGTTYAALEKGGATLGLGMNDGGTAIGWRRYILATESYGTIRQGDVGWQWNTAGDVNRLRVYFQGYTDHSDLLRFDGALLTVGETGGAFTFATAILGTSITVGSSWLVADASRVTLGVPIRLQNQGTLPGSGSLGDTLFGTTAGLPLYWNGTAWARFSDGLASTDTRGERTQDVVGVTELTFPIPESDVAFRIFARLKSDLIIQTWCGTLLLHYVESPLSVQWSVDTLDGDNAIFAVGEPSITGSGASRVLHVALSTTASGSLRTARV